MLYLCNFGYLILCNFSYIDLIFLCREYDIRSYMEPSLDQLLKCEKNLKNSLRLVMDRKVSFTLSIYFYFFEKKKI